MSEKRVEEEKIQSPCVSICALDMEDVCVGCHRTGDEITRWWGMDRNERLETLKKAREREEGSLI